MVEPVVDRRRADSARSRMPDQRVYGGNHYVAPQGEFGSAGERASLHFGDYRLVDVGDDEHLPHLPLHRPDIVVEGADAAAIFAFGVRLVGGIRTEAEVVTRAKILPGPLQDDDVD